MIIGLGEARPDHLAGWQRLPYGQASKNTNSSHHHTVSNYTVTSFIGLDWVERGEALTSGWTARASWQTSNIQYALLPPPHNLKSKCDFIGLDWIEESEAWAFGWPAVPSSERRITWCYQLWRPYSWQKSILSTVRLCRTEKIRWKHQLPGPSALGRKQVSWMPKATKTLHLQIHWVFSLAHLDLTWNLSSKFVPFLCKSWPNDLARWQAASWSAPHLLAWAWHSVAREGRSADSHALPRLSLCAPRERFEVHHSQEVGPCK